MGHFLLPVGWFPKERIRAMAAQAGLPVADKADSQEICFIPNGDYRQFLREQVGPPQPGDIVDLQGSVLGQHPGVPFFTVGQRHGLGIATGEKLFVVQVDAQRNRVVVGPQEALLQHHLWASRVNYLSGQPPPGPIEVAAKIRYKGAEAPATLEPHGDAALLRFHQPQRAVTPGQAVVFYQDDQVLGGGFIEGTQAPSANGPHSSNESNAAI